MGKLLQNWISRKPRYVFDNNGVHAVGAIGNGRCGWSPSIDGGFDFLCATCFFAPGRFPRIAEFFRSIANGLPQTGAAMIPA